MLDYNSTKNDIEEQYKIEGSIIKSLGKFEGEQYFVPVLWEYVSNSFTRTVFLTKNTQADIITIDIGLAERFDELTEGDKYLLEETDQGFVDCTYVSESVKSDLYQLGVDL